MKYTYNEVHAVMDDLVPAYLSIYTCRQSATGFETPSLHMRLIDMYVARGTREITSGCSTPASDL